MHEFSIATALVDLVKQHCPPGEKVERVSVSAGPMRGIEPSAMQWAWEAAIDETFLEGSELDLKIELWQMRCPACKKIFAAKNMFEPCECGCETTSPVEGNELKLISLTLADPPGPPENTSWTSPLSKTC